MAANGDRLNQLLDERVHLRIRINLIENGKPAEIGLMPLLRRRLASTEKEIDGLRRELSTGWQAHAFAAGVVR